MKNKVNNKRRLLKQKQWNRKNKNLDNYIHTKACACFVLRK